MSCSVSKGIWLSSISIYSRCSSCLFNKAKVNSIFPATIRLYSAPSQPPSGKKVYLRDKPHINIGTIGHIDHGKTTLTAAITHVLSKKKMAKKKKYDEIDNLAEEKARGITIRISYVEYMTDNRYYTHSDCPGHADYIKNMITGTSQMDGAILVVAAVDGVMPQTREHLILAKQIGLENIIVFINKVDIADLEMVEVVEMEVRELLTQLGFQEEKTPFVRGSALAALKNTNSEIGANSILKLMDTVDKSIPVPQKNIDKPFLLSIEHTHSVPGRGTAVTGRIEQGIIHKGDEVVIEGYKKSFKTTVSGIESFHKQMDYGESGDQVGILVRGVKRDDVQRGMVMAKPNSISSHNHFDTHLYLLSKDEGGRPLPIVTAQYCFIYSKTLDIYSRIEVLGKEMLMIGEDGEVSFKTTKPIVMEVGQRFTIRMKNQTVGTGIVTKIHPNMTPEEEKIIQGGEKARRKAERIKARKEELKNR